MVIGERLRVIRGKKNLTQSDIEKRTGLLRCYISRVEKGHTVPAVENLEKMARALEVPLYQLFYDGEEPLQIPNVLMMKSPESEKAWGSTGSDADYLYRLRSLLAKVREDNRKLVLNMALKMANR